MKVKGKLAPLQSMEAYGEEEIWFHSFLTTTLMQVSGQLHVPAFSPLPAEELCYQPNRRVGGATEPVWKFLR